METKVNKLCHNMNLVIFTDNFFRSFETIVKYHHALDQVGK